MNPFTIKCSLITLFCVDNFEDHFFVDKLPSRVAIATILYLVDEKDCQIDESEWERWIWNLFNESEIEIDGEIRNLIERLSFIYDSSITWHDDDHGKSGVDDRNDYPQEELTKLQFEKRITPSPSTIMDTICSRC